MPVPPRASMPGAPPEKGLSPFWCRSAAPSGVLPDCGPAYRLLFCPLSAIAVFSSVLYWVKPAYRTLVERRPVPVSVRVLAQPILDECATTLRAIDAERLLVLFAFHVSALLTVVLLAKWNPNALQRTHYANRSSRDMPRAIR